MSGAQITPNPQERRKKHQSLSSSAASNDKALIKARLEFAKSEGKKRRRAITLPTLGFGFALFIPGGCIFSLCKVLVAMGEIDQDPWAAISWIGGWMGAAGIPILLLALLPEDVELIPKVVRAVVAVFLCFAFPVFVGLGVLAYQGKINGCKDVFGMDSTVPCWYADVAIAWPVIMSLSYVVIGSLLLKESLKAQPRELLNYAWTCLGRWYCFLSLFVFPLASFVRLSFEPINLDIFFLIILCVELFACGSLLMFRGPELRQRAQAFLAIRGESMGIAAGIASLIGNVGEDELLKLSSKVFMGVPLDRVGEVAMKKNDPDPELNKLADNVSFGKVDCFFSHSWRDHKGECFPPPRRSKRVL
jgi:hypothetical protein